MSLCLCGCLDLSDDAEVRRDGIITEGVIFSVEYALTGDRTGGFTRLNNSAAVPGGNGSWNVDAYGRLTQDYLLITYPGQENRGVHVIPAHRLIDVKFGDGGLQFETAESTSDDVGT